MFHINFMDYSLSTPSKSMGYERRGQAPITRLSHAFRLLAGLILLGAALMAQSAWSAEFPSLSGRVVDAGAVLAPATRRQVEEISSDLEAKTGAQLVVATVPSMEGELIERYANQLFRHWELGQVGEDNGVLLLVALSERQVRIEVGYGLEGTVTDALAASVIRSDIVPSFKQGDLDAGVLKGAETIASLILGTYEPAPPKPRGLADVFIDFIVNVAVGLFLLVIFGVMALAFIAGPQGPRKYNPSRYTSLRSSSGSSFSGGGGSSGGGGASGSW